MDPDLLAALIQELGPYHPAIRKLTKGRTEEMKEQLQIRLGIHPILIKLRQASRDYETGEGTIRARISALRACEELGLDSDDMIKAMELGRRDARIALAVRLQN